MPFALLGFAFERYYDVVFAYLALTFPDRRLARWDRVVLGLLAGAFVVRSDVPAARGVHLHRDGQPARPGPRRPAVRGAPGRDQLGHRRRRPRRGGAGAAAAAAGTAGRPQDPLARRRGGRAGCRRGGVRRPRAGRVRAHRPRGCCRSTSPWEEVASWTIISLVVLVALGFLAGTLRMRIGHGVVARMAARARQRRRPGPAAGRAARCAGRPRARAPARRRGRAVGRRDRPPRRPARRPAGPRPGRHDARGTGGTRGRDRPRPEPQRGHRADGGHGVGPAFRPRERPPDGDRPRAAGGGPRVSHAAGRRRRGRTAPDRARPPRRRPAATDRSDADAAAGARAGAPRVIPTAPYVQLLDDASDELLAAVDELRELARGIHPAILTEVGLRPAVAGLARRSAVPVDLQVELTDRLEPGVEAAAYFIVAEALTNVTRHSGARQRGRADRAPRRSPAGPGERRRGRRRRRVARDRAGGDQRPAGGDLGRAAASTARAAAGPRCGRRSRARDRGRRLGRHQGRGGPDPVRRRHGRRRRGPHGRRAARPGRRAPARPGRGRHPDASGRQRRATRGHLDPRRVPGGGEDPGALAVPGARLRPRACSTQGWAASATCSRTGWPTATSSSRPPSGSAKAARPSTPPWSASWCAPGGASTGSPG